MLKIVIVILIVILIERQAKRLQNEERSRAEGSGVERRTQHLATN